MIHIHVCQSWKVSWISNTGPSVFLHQEEDDMVGWCSIPGSDSEVVWFSRAAELMQNSSPAEVILGSAKLVMCGSSTDRVCGC